MIHIRLAKSDDYDFFYTLKSEESNIFWSGYDAPPDYAQMKVFFDNAIAGASVSENRKIYIVMNEQEPVGHLYLIPDGNDFELAPAIVERFWRNGYATQSIAAGLAEGKRLGFTKMKTHIREDNIASLHAFRACDIHSTGDFVMKYIPKLGKEVKMLTVAKKL